MAIETDFIQFLDKPSGVYRLTRDKSQVSTVGAASTIPLIIGFSKKGLFNTPVYCTDSDYFTGIFGDVDRTLERKGSWFHRTALELLTISPVIVLNLYNLKNEVPTDIDSISLTDPLYDITEFKSLSIGSTYTNDDKKKELYKHFYNTDKFWFPDGDELNKFASLGNDDSLLHFVNIGQKPVTILTRKSDVNGFNVSLNEWYGLDNVPEYLNGYDYVEDFFIDVIILSGDFTDYAKLSIDPIFGQYFDKTKGIKKDKLTAFLSLSQVTVLDIYQGSVIPGFIDKIGQVLDIAALVNANTSRTGVLASINEDALEDGVVSGTKVDLIGHNLFSRINYDLGTGIEFLSYNGDIINKQKVNALEKATTASYLTFGAVSGSTTKKTLKLTIPSTVTSFAYSALYNLVNANELGYGNKMKLPITDGTNHAIIEFIVDTAKMLNTDAVITFKTFEFADSNIAGATAVYDTTITEFNTVPGITHTVFNTYFQISNVGNTVILNIPNTATGTALAVYNMAKDGKVAVGDKFSGVGLTDGTHSGVYELVTNFVSFNSNGNLVIEFVVPNYSTSTITPSLAALNTALGSNITFKNISLVYSYDESPLMDFKILTNHNITLNNNEVIVDRVTFGYNNNKSIQLDKYVVSEIDDEEETSRLTRIVRIEKITNVGWKIITEAPIYTGTGNLIYSEGIDSHFDHYDMVSLFGFRIKDRMIPNGSNERMNEIYGVINSTNLYNTLLDKKAITFRYVIDTFNHGLENSSKAVLSKLCKYRENAFAILNAPSIKEFRESQDPLFADLPTTSNPKPNFDMKYIPQGGNLQNNPTFRYTLPSELDGSAYCAFYMPNVLVRERGKTFSAPVAPYVAKNFILKHINFRPWSIIAGNKRGVISGTNVVGLDYQIDDKERGYLEKFGINPIVLDSSDGLVITSNSTAKQNIKTSLSQINGTEVLIYIQDRVAEVLKKYIWEFNTPELRLEVKTIVDGELQQIKIDGGIYDFVNIMNNTNNTNETIDNLLGILDSHIEVAKGLAKAIHRTTIQKTGQIATGIL